MNKERLQNYNEILNENNTSLEDINNIISNLPDIGGFIEAFEINDASYLFYANSRLDIMDKILSLCKNVTKCSNMFRSSNSLTELDLSNFDTSNVTSFADMFSDCAKLERLNISNFDTSNVKTLYRMFYNCAVLEQLDLSNFDTSNVTNMSNMCNYCRVITNINVSSFDTSNVTNCQSAFCNCFDLVDLDLSSFDLGKVTEIGNMLGSATDLTNLKSFKNLGKGYTRATNGYSSYTLTLSSSKNLTYESLIDVITNGLYDLNLTYDVASGKNLYTQKLVIGADNIAKLNAEDLLIATNKGWVVS